MTLGESIRDALVHPLSAFLAVLGALSATIGIPWLDPVLLALWHNAGSLFTAFSVASATLAPEVEWLPEDAIRYGAILTGALFVLTQLDKILDSIKKRT